MSEFDIEKIEQRKTGQDFNRETSSSDLIGFLLGREKKDEKFRIEEQRELNAFREVVKSGTGNKELDKVLENDKKYQKLRQRASKTLNLKDKVDEELTRKAYVRYVDKDGNVKYALKRKYKSSKGKEMIKKAADNGFIVGANALKKGFSTVAKDAGANFQSDGKTEDFEKSAKVFTDFATHSVKNMFKGAGGANEVDKLAKKSEELRKQIKSMQKKMNQRRSILNYQRNHKNSATAKASENVFKAAKKKVAEAARKAMQSKLLIVGLVVLLLMSLLSSCVIIFDGIFGGSSTVTVGAYTARNDEIEQAENYFHRYEESLVEAIYRYEDWLYNTYAPARYGAVDREFVDEDGVTIRIAVDYNLQKVWHDPNVLIAYLTVMFEDFEFNERDLNVDEVASHILYPLFYECYGVSPTNPEGSTFYGFQENGLANSIAPLLSGTHYGSTEQVNRPDGTYYYCKVWYWELGGNFRSLEDVVQERINSLPEDKQTRYQLLRSTQGALFVASNVLGDINMHDNVVQTYGYQPYDSAAAFTPIYTVDGWRPRSAQNFTETFVNYAVINTDLSGDPYNPGIPIYAGGEGVVDSITGEKVVIKYNTSSLNCNQFLVFESVEDIYVTRGQSVLHNTEIGKSTGTMNVYYYEQDFWGNIKYRNPLIYIGY